MPGFALAKAAADAFERDRSVEGLILHKHGIFTFGGDAREAYERMIEMVSLAESRLRQGRPIVFPARQLTGAVAAAADIAPIIRGACAISKEGAEPTRFIADFRTAPEILAYVNGADLASYSQRGVVTPDHIIRTKNRPLVVPPPETGKLDAFAGAVREAVAKFVADYKAFHKRDFPYDQAPLCSSSCYDHVFMLVEAMKKAGTASDRKKIRDALAGFRHEGVIGTIQFDKNGQANPPVYVTQWCSDGRRRVIYPESMKADCGAG